MYEYAVKTRSINIVCERANANVILHFSVRYACKYNTQHKLWYVCAVCKENTQHKYGMCVRYSNIIVIMYDVSVSRWLKTNNNQPN